MLIVFFCSPLAQFQSLTNLPCGLESNNNIATAGVSMDEEDGSVDDDDHIRNGLSDDDYGDHTVSTSFTGLSKAAAGETLINGTRNGGRSRGSGSGTGIEKFRIDYPKKFQNARSMSLSMERNAYCELCRFTRSPVPFDLGGSAEDGGGGGEPDNGDKGVRRYFGFTIKQYMALGSLALVDFLGFCSMSVMAPTFPKEVHFIIILSITHLNQYQTICIQL